MNDGMMPDRNIMADGGTAFLKSTMDTGPILDIYLITHPDKIDISTDDRVEPETAVITGNDITYDSGIGRDKAVFAELRENIVYGKYIRHVKEVKSKK
jgi:hypothetical protein